MKLSELQRHLKLRKKLENKSPKEKWEFFVEQFKEKGTKLEKTCKRCGSTEVYDARVGYICLDCGWTVIDALGGLDFKDEKKLEKMRDEIAELPTKDSVEYCCPNCESNSFTEYYAFGDETRPYKFQCNICHTIFSRRELDARGCIIKKDIVNHPEHYISKDGIESIDVIRAFTRDLKWMEAVCTANILKYMMRWKHKNGLEDLKKAQWYLNYLIAEVEGED